MTRRFEAFIIGISLIFAFTTSSCVFDTSGISIDKVPDPTPNSYECGCTCTAMQPSRVLRRSPEQSEDDAEEYLSSGAVRLDGIWLDLITEGVTGEEQVVGIRFPNIGIPQGATILKAHVKFTVREATSETTNLTIQGEYSGDAAIFGAANGNISSRTRTSNYVEWIPPAWNTAGDAGTDQRTPDLAALIQEIVDGPDWVAGNAMATIITGTGRRVAVPFDQDPTGVPWLEIEYEVPTLPINVDLHVCYPETLTTIDADCQNRVENTLSAMAQACNYPSECECTATADSELLNDGCSDGCIEEELDLPDCTNFDPAANPPKVTATNAPSNDPVCTVNSPLAATLFGRRSTCVLLDGGASIDIDGKTPENQPGAAGFIDIIGDPCPDEACDVGMSYIVDLDPVKFSNFWGSVTFRELAAVGGSLPGSEVLLTPAGVGTFGVDTVGFTARGRKESEVEGYVGTNNDLLDLSVDWGPVDPSCRLEGALVGATNPEISYCENAGPDANEICESGEECQDDPECSDGICNCESVEDVGMTIALDVEGDIINQPPTADAGGDQVVECNLPGKARFTLDGSASNDPDHNIALSTWFRNSRVGPAVGFQPVIPVEQALDTGISYVLRVIDAGGQADEDTSVVGVIDTTPPEVFCNAPSTIVPPDAPISFASTAVDICDPQVPTEITDFDCYKYTKKGKRIDKTESCIVSISGDTITILDSGGVDDHIVWDIRATDDSGNVREVTCEVEVVRP